MSAEIPRSRQARLAAEQALVRIVHHYGGKPEFVVLGGLVPELLCSSSARQHAGTTDIDVQVNLEIECDAVNTARLERALRNAEFEPDSEGNEVTLHFDDCERLGAVNLRGTKYATQDIESRTLTAKVGNDRRSVEINVTGVAGFLLAKCAAAYSRRKPKDWYDIAFVLLHNDLGGPILAAQAVVDRLGKGALKASRTALAELAANFADPQSQGPAAYADQFLVDHPDYDQSQAKADAVTAVAEFCEAFGRG